MTINTINVHGARGLGLGRKSIRLLIKKYGQLSSDPQGNTSDLAIKMWKSIGAEKRYTDKNTKGWFWTKKTR